MRQSLVLLPLMVSLARFRSNGRIRKQFRGRGILAREGSIFLDLIFIFCLYKWCVDHFNNSIIFVAKSWSKGDKNACLSVFSLPIYPTIYLIMSLYPSTYSTIILSIHPPIYLSTFQSICLSVCLYIYLGSYLSLYLSTCLIIYRSIFLYDGPVWALGKT